MLLYNPLLILHQQTCKIPVCFDPAVLGGQQPPNLQAVAAPDSKQISQWEGENRQLIPMRNLANPPESAKVNTRRDTPTRAKTLQNAPPNLRAVFNPAASP
jgi:hypothetical protein